MSEDSLYEIVMAAAADAPLPPPKAPRPSASVIPWRRIRDRIQVYWVRRTNALAFMGGWYAFPGGGLSRKDLPVPVAGSPQAVPEPFAATVFLDDGHHETPPDLVPGLTACVLRELFEETGLLLTTEPMPETVLARLSQERQQLLGKQRPFAELLNDLGVELSADRLTFAGRWLTPPLAPMRFDNRFFLLEWPESERLQPEIFPGELDAGEWIDPAEAHARWSEGDVVTAPPILHALKVLADAGPVDGLARLQQPDEASLGPFRRIEFRPGVILLPLETATLPPANRTNAILLGTRERVLIDPGSSLPAEQEKLEAAIAALPPGTVTAIWLTHHHPDHIGGVERARQALKVPVLAHRLTAERLAERDIRVDGFLEDGEVRVLNGEPPFPVRIFHTPGHARGHLCFLEENRRSLIGGDLVAGFGTIVIDPPEGDMDDYLHSLERMADLAPGTLFPAHGPPLRDATGSFRHYIEHRLWREAKVLAAWRDGLREPAAIRPQVYEDTPKPAWPLAERQIKAHLQRLDRAGRLAG
ncbi:MAG: MBL fold metallo-hydrolase [Acidobacteriota bacterium]